MEPILQDEFNSIKHRIKPYQDKHVRISQRLYRIRTGYYEREVFTFDDVLKLNKIKDELLSYDVDNNTIGLMIEFNKIANFICQTQCKLGYLISPVSVQKEEQSLSRYSF